MRTWGKVRASRIIGTTTRSWYQTPLKYTNSAFFKVSSCQKLQIWCSFFSRMLCFLAVAAPLNGKRHERGETVRTNCTTDARHFRKVCESPFFLTALWGEKNAGLMSWWFGYKQFATCLLLKDVTFGKSRHAVCLERVWIRVKVMNVFLCVSSRCFQKRQIGFWSFPPSKKKIYPHVASLDEELCLKEMERWHFTKNEVFSEWNMRDLLWSDCCTVTATSSYTSTVSESLSHILCYPPASWLVQMSQYQI